MIMISLNWFGGWRVIVALSQFYLGDLVENVKCIDSFQHPVSKQNSLCYRITYRSMDRNLTNEEIDQMQDNIRNEVTERLHVKLR